MKIAKQTVIRLYYLCAIIAFGIGVCDFMYTQESFMSGLAITGVGILFAVMVWSLLLLPNPKLRFAAPPLGITAFLLFVVYTFAIIVLIPKADMTIVTLVVRMAMHVFFVLVMIGAYRWYSFNDLGNGDKICFAVVLGMLCFTYLRIVIYCFANLHFPHLNTSYYLLFVLPVMLTVKAIKWKALYVVVSFVVLITSMKRGGAAALMVGMMVYVIVYLKIRSYNIVKAVALLFVAIVLIACLALFLGTSEIEGESQNLVERFESVGDDGGSNRDIVYGKTLDLIDSQDGLSLLVGNGYNAVLVDSPIHLSAHNDFLEILYDYGLVGLSLYLVFVLSFLKVSLRAFRKNADIAPVLCFQFSNFFILSNISHVFIYMLMPFVTFTYGVGLGYMRKLESAA